MKKSDNIGIIIQARMSSSRLPGKVMLKLKGHEVLWHVVERCRQSKANRVIVATSIDPNDDAIVSFCKKNHIDVFRGSLNNVLERYYQCAKKYKLDSIVRITSDCPLIDPLIINKAIAEFKKGDWDYVSDEEANQSEFPLGLCVEIFSFESFKKVRAEAKAVHEQEHVTPRYYENKNEFQVAPRLKAPPEYRVPYRLTLDYPEDFEMMGKIYDALYRPNTIIDLKGVFDFLKKNPKIASINQHAVQKIY